MNTMSLKGIKIEELSFKINNIRVEKDAKMEIKQNFSRQIRKFNDNDKVFAVVLSVIIANTDDAPSPFDINIRIAGIFESKEAYSDGDMRYFAIDATKLLYPYLRSQMTNLTAMAYIPPINLPVVDAGSLFPEDRQLILKDGQGNIIS